jgi:hypothetical protein
VSTVSRFALPSRPDWVAQRPGMWFVGSDLSTRHPVQIVKGEPGSLRGRVLLTEERVLLTEGCTDARRGRVLLTEERVLLTEGRTDARRERVLLTEGCTDARRGRVLLIEERVLLTITLFLLRLPHHRDRLVCRRAATLR